MKKTAAALHILVKEEKLAQEILVKLERGISFDHLAKRYSCLLYTSPSPRDS